MGLPGQGNRLAGSVRGMISESERGLYVGRWRVFLFSSAIARHHVGGGVAMWFPPLPRPRHHLKGTRGQTRFR